MNEFLPEQRHKVGLHLTHVTESGGTSNLERALYEIKKCVPVNECEGCVN